MALGDALARPQVATERELTMYQIRTERGYDFNPLMAEKQFEGFEAAGYTLHTVMSLGTDVIVVFKRKPWWQRLFKRVQSHQG